LLHFCWTVVALLLNSCCTFVGQLLIVVDSCSCCWKCLKTDEL